MPLSASHVEHVKPLVALSDQDRCLVAQVLLVHLVPAQAREVFAAPVGRGYEVVEVPYRLIPGTSI